MAVNDLLTNVVLNTIWLVLCIGLRRIVPRIAARLVTIPIYTVVLVLITDVPKIQHIKQSGRATRL